MTTINVQFSDATQATVVSYFAGPQDPVIYPDQSQIDTGDSRWKAFYEANTDMQPFIPAPSEV